MADREQGGGPPGQPPGQPSAPASSQLPYGLETIKAGALRSMTTDKLASFSLGATKKTPYQVGRPRRPLPSRACTRTHPARAPWLWQKLKEAKEAKRREQEEAAQAELNAWVEQFDGGDEQGAGQGGAAQSAELHAPLTIEMSASEGDASAPAIPRVC